jgi:hypothetical protein
MATRFGVELRRSATACFLVPHCHALIRWKRAVALIRRAVPIGSFIWLSAFTMSASADFMFPDFSDTTGLTLVGSADVIEQRLRLNPDEGSQVGTVWFTTKQAVAGGFVTTFQSQISVDGADGFAFVIQNESLAVGDIVTGFYGIPNSLAIEFDTWQNIPEDHASGVGDPNNNHISVQTRGLFPNSPDPVFSIGTATDIPYMSDGNLHAVKIAYSPSLLRISIDDLDTPALNVMVDLPDLLALDSGRAWVGLTGFTGGVSEAHDILSWSFSEGVAAVPEPDTILLLTTLALGLLTIRPKR